MLKNNRLVLAAFLLADVVILLLYQQLGATKAFASWNWIDIASEGGSSALTALWGLMVLGSRPKGLVTRLLVGGLLCISMGGWADFLDEFFSIPQPRYWAHLLESGLTLIGMITLTRGLYLWREEQFSLSEHMQKRERLFRDHRAFDRITQLANADYLRRQIVQEKMRNPVAPCALLLLDVNEFHQINRQFGQQEGDRVLQALTHLLLLNLRNDDLLCRYAGDRYVILLPETTAEGAEQRGRELENAVKSLAHHSRHGGERIALSIRVVSAAAQDSAEELLSRLNSQIETPPAMMATMPQAA